MSPSAQNFTLLRIDNTYTASVVQGYYAPGYSETPALMTGELQRQCQAAFRSHMEKGTSPKALVELLSQIITEASENYLALDILAANAAYALSAPCDDYPSIFAYINHIFEEVDETYFRYCRDTTSKIIEGNLLNPYIAFKQAPTEIWGRLDDAFDMYRNDVLLQLAVIFDDDKMVEKIASHRPNRSIADKVTSALSRVPYDPLSKVRSWLGSPNPTMFEIEHRIALQKKIVGDIGFAVVDFSMKNSPFSAVNPYRSKPEYSTHTSFQAGVFSLSNLEIPLEDHALRHLPGYSNFVKAFPSSIGKFLHHAISNAKGQALIPILIGDLRNAGIPGHEILYLHIDNTVPGKYLDRIADPSLKENFIKELLSFSGRSDEVLKAHNLAMKTLLSFEDNKDIDLHAITDTELRSAYLVTQDRKYLNLLSEHGVEEHLDHELGL